MPSRCNRMLYIAVLLSTLFLGFVQAATDDKTRIGNSTIERTVQLRTHSVYAPYIDVDLQNRWWDFGADSYVNTNKHIRLTRPRPSQMGWLWSRLALTASNFVIEAEFKISGESSHLFGDGLALWLTTDRAKPGPVFGSEDNFNGLGLFVDTYPNARHSFSFPRISAMLGDGKTSYDFGNDGEGQVLGACSANVRRTNVATKIKLTYVKGKFLDVKLQYKAWDDWSDCIYLENVTLPTNPYLGFSAMTGDVADAHDIISVTTYSAILSAPEASRNKMKKTGIWSMSDEASSTGTWFGLFFKLLVFGGICAGGFYGYKEWLRRKAYGGGGGFGMGGDYGRGGPGGGFGGMYSNTKRF
ncbi:ERGIC53, mannose lectin, ER-golgi intermediate compartment [Crucibulum laeve]|uniref:ERGIC53, mannose lectin, ER-golgi intermediate compartment n=1 Tax=Crucibulum laeve TaxID=68775 RepID=A0A5C3MM73_9AGAR|nr:ERGIC53, mannose lectin, ER-golgi intermediate compartment [Crucibulum laeve]